jgi:dipeptidase
MKKLLLLLIIVSQYSFACTNFLITKGASSNGHTYIFYANDGAYAPSFPVHLGQMYAMGDSIKITSWGNQQSGFIYHNRKEYHTIGYHINEFQVSIGETTFGGRKELHNTDEFLEYWHLMELGLKRAKTAKEMIKVITNLVEEYGYGSEGESFSIADPNEAWILEMTGKGNGNKGAVWVAVKIPDGYVSAHANHARIGNFDLKDSKNVMYSKDVISFAIEKGFYNPKTDGDFSFCDAYDPITPAKLRYTEMRVWDFFRRVSPSLNISPNYARGVQGAERMPLWIKPDKKLSLEDIMDLSRSHYDDTKWDMEKGYKAGPHGNPNRSRPLTFEVDGVEASWERPISTPLTAYAFIAELRKEKSKKMGAVLWLGLDNTYTNIYLPINNMVNKIPDSYNNTDYNKFSWDSMWWSFNFVGNYVNLRYRDMIVDVKEKQKTIQMKIIENHKVAENKAYQMKTNESADFLTNYIQEEADSLLSEWNKLGATLIVKYNDGLVRDKNMNVKQKGYCPEFYRKSIKDDTERILPVWDEKSENIEPNNY